MDPFFFIVAPELFTPGRLPPGAPGALEELNIFVVSSAPLEVLFEPL